MRAFRREEVASVEELASLSGMPLARAKKLWPLLVQRDYALDATTDDRGPAIDRLRDPAQTPEDLYARLERDQQVRLLLGEALGTLSDRERRIVERRLLTEKPQTLESLGAEFGVSKERVRQLEARAHGKLRGVLRDYEPVAA